MLAELYPNDGDAHRGTYWKARALEELGRPEEAREVYRGLVASSDTTDFYSRQALARLGDTQPAEGLALAQAPAGGWPEEPALQRVKMLTDLGLDELASQELELVAAKASPARRAGPQGAHPLPQGRAAQRPGAAARGLPRPRRPLPGERAGGGPLRLLPPAGRLRRRHPLLRPAHRRAGHLVAGIIRQESAFDPRATSPVGARGLMQLMPATARELSQKAGVSYQPERLYEPDLSVRLGTSYVRELLDAFDGNVELALAGYNGGPNRIRRLWKESGRKPAWTTSWRP